MKLLRRLRSNMSISVIGGLVGLMLLFGLAVVYIGNICFVSAFKNEYATVTYHMADSVTSYVDGDLIDDFLAGEDVWEYIVTKNDLDVSCRKLNVSLIYVIAVDRSDYGRFVSVFNSVNNSVDDSNYTEWELGHKRDTTNDEYREKYRALYEKRSDYETVFRLQTNDGSHPHITTLVPVKNDAGDVTALLCIQRPMREMTDAFRPYLLMILAGVLFAVLIASLLATFFLRHSVIRPVSRVSAEASRFAKENAKSEPLGALSRYDVIRDLALSIDSMETDMEEYIRNLTAATAERERMGAELSIAAQIQSDSLPDVFPAFPDRHEFDIYAAMNPAKEVGGDFYNFFLTDHDHLALLMADVSGKGIPAALFMMQANILITGRAQMGGTPAEILRDVNASICARNGADMFVTVWLGILEISTGRLVYANAGHEYPALCRKVGDFELEKGPHSFVLGGLEGVNYQDAELRLHAGDKLFLYTDGLPEATDGDGRMFSLGRMITALNAHRSGSPREIVENVQQDVDAFVGDTPQFDDLTMLCLELKETAEG
nr:PP2C family protein-serine/threonine phosphatase [Lachnospiraceae bacterium]